MGNPSLAWVIAAFAAVTVAEWAYVTALAVDVLRRDGTFAVGLVGLRLFVGALSSLVAVGLAPARPAGRALTTIASVRAVGLAASAAVSALGGALVPLLLLLAVDAVASAQYRPAQSRLVPQLARNPTELVACGAALSTVKTLSQAVGGVCGGLALVLTAPAEVFAGAAALFALAAGITFRSRRLGLPPMPASGAARPRRPETVVRTVRDAFRAVGRSQMAGVAAVGGLRTFVRGMWTAIAIIASIRLLHAGTAGVGLLMLAAGLGSLLAAPLSSKVIARSRLGTPVVLALLVCGVPLAAMAGVSSFDLALALVAAWAVGMAVADVATTSLLYRLVETPLVPQVTGVMEAAKLALEGLGAFLAPALVASVGTRVTLLVAALPLPVFALVGWKSFHRADASARARAELLELVQGVPWLQLIDIASLDNLLGRLARVYVPAGGTDVVEQGERGRHFYIVANGKAEVLVNGFVVGSVSRGDSFGERALLRDVPRMATVRSCGRMDLLMLSRADFLAATTGQDGSRTGPLDNPTGQGRPAGGSLGPVERDWTPRHRLELLARLAVFSQLGMEELSSLAERAVVDYWAEGAAVLRQGNVGDRFYVVLDGRASVSVDGHDVAELWPGDPFGEIALLHAVPRTADVRAATALVTMSLDRKDFLPAVRSELFMG
ncbi:MAG: cyclic nucleotide-binding domain-containing protein [Acidimicrobiales bacterium]